MIFDFNWYNELNKPLLSPPSWLFTPVWGFLYLTIITALLLYIFGISIKKKTYGYLYFGIQMLLNLLWTPAFFALKNILLAFVIVILMDIFIFLTIKEFYDINKPSGILLIPYFLWSLFATYLTAGYIVLN